MKYYINMTIIKSSLNLCLLSAIINFCSTFVKYQEMVSIFINFFLSFSSTLVRLNVP